VSRKFRVLVTVLESDFIFSGELFTASYRPNAFAASLQTLKHIFSLNGIFKKTAIFQNKMSRVHVLCESCVILGRNKTDKVWRKSDTIG